MNVELLLPINPDKEEIYGNPLPMISLDRVTESLSPLSVVPANVIVNLFLVYISALRYINTVFDENGGIYISVSDISASRYIIFVVIDGLSVTST